MDFTDLLNKYHIMPQFPPSAVRQTAKMPTEVAARDTEGREDLTSKLIITIDGDDAKDFDDAVSLEKTKDGSYILGVHIADVTHYVTEGSAIDNAAFLRGTSVYLIDTVVPMLPFELSNGLCSLRPNEIRLTLSVFMEFTQRGKMTGYRISKSFIRSHDRMTYNNVTKILEGDKELCKRYAHLVPMLKSMKRLAEILKKKRRRRGEIDFVTHESKITLDASGKPVSVERYPITVSNGIIEEFMLICNETVAAHMSKAKLPCVFRVHEKPDMTRIDRLSEILTLMGVEFEPSKDMKPKDFQRVLESVADTERFDVVNYLVLRTMSKAKYSEKNEGHFGLATANYCHFTSPIRRYPDLAVHRILKESMDGRIEGRRLSELREFVTAAAVSSSASEVNAAEAEFAWKDAKKTEYMAEKIGEKFSGIITHITRAGFFVELENTVEGFVAARTIEDDIYVLDENGFEMRGINGGKRYTVGAAVEIRVLAADTETNKIDFELCGGKLPCMRSKKGDGGRRRELKKANREALREIKEEKQELYRQRAELRDKADFERSVFEGAVTDIITRELVGKMKLKRDEKRFVGITVTDMAARIAEPLYRSFVFENTDYRLEESVSAAVRYTKAAVSSLCADFGAEDGGAERFAAELVRASMRHFDARLHREGMSRTRREKEYSTIEDWVRRGLKSGKVEGMPSFPDIPEPVEPKKAAVAAKPKKQPKPRKKRGGKSGFYAKKRKGFGGKRKRKR